jgi:dihydrodipicolinate synthase/N-acetylneuraminate lyase
VIDRRQWMRMSSGVLWGSSLYGVRPSRSAPTPADFQKGLKGPICSVPTVYDESFRLDSEGFRNIVKTGVKAGCRVFALTAGNSQYDRLTYDEVKELTRTLVDSVAGRGLTIAATGQWWTGQVIDYARFSENAGADALQVFVPTFGDSDTVFEHFQKIAAATKLGIVLHGQVPMPLLKRLLSIDSIVAYKEEYPPSYSTEVFALYGKRLNIFAGGQKSRYLIFQPYGMQAYYSTFSTFAPEVTRKFWDACQAGDLTAARDVVVKYDVPFFQKWSHAYWRATLETFGLAKRYLRPPDRYFTTQQVSDVKPFFRELGLL